MTHSPKDSIDFGYETVATEEKARRVREVFSSVATKYDVMNDVMSGGLHRLWKDHFVSRLHLTPGMTCLDVAGGTGDIAFRIQDTLLKRTRQQMESPRSSIIVSDINADMLSVGRDRAINQLRPRYTQAPLTWVCANAESLPLPSTSIDRYTITFGIRNVTHRDDALREAHRCLKPGGLFACMEFSPSVHPLLSKLYDGYSLHLLPRLGSLIAGDADSYRYLAESIRRFPPATAFAAQIKAAGFDKVTHHSLTGGIVTLYYGWKY